MWSVSACPCSPYVAFQANATFQGITTVQPTYELGAGSTVPHRGVVFTNAALDGDTNYYVFVRAFSSRNQVSGRGRDGVNRGWGWGEGIRVGRWGEGMRVGWATRVWWGRGLGWGEGMRVGRWGEGMRVRRWGEGMRVRG